MTPPDDWRASAGHRPAAGTDWRRGRAPSVAATGTKFRWRAALGWTAFLAVCAGFIWLSTWVRPPVPGRLVLLGAGYETNLLIPDNVCGMNTLRTFAQPTGPVAALMKLGPAGVAELRSDFAWETLFDKISEASLVVVVSAQAGNDAKGPYILAHDSDLRDTPRQRVRIEAILDKLAKLPTQQKKLLILDLGHMPSQPALGMVHNDFARALALLEPRIAAIPNLLVMCATAPDEQAWTCPEWAGTVFGHFLIEGCRGAADTDEDRRINVWELWQFLQANVNRWTKINRLAEQSPRLYPSGEEGERLAKKFLVTLTDRDYSPLPIDTIPEATLSPAVRSAWEQWQTLDSMSPHPAAFAPYRWQQYQAGIFRLENLARFGDAAAVKLMEDQLRRWEQAFKKDAAIPARSLDHHGSIAKSQPSGKVNEKLEKAFEKLWEAPSEEDAKKVWAGWLKNQEKEPGSLPSRQGLTHLLLQRAIQEPDKLEEVAQRLRLLREGSRPFPPEAHYLVMLQRDLPGNPPQAEAEEILPQALRLRQLAEQVDQSPAKAGYSYREYLLPWIEKRWLDADSDRQLGQDQLLTGAASDWRTGREFLKSADDQYRRLQADISHVRNAFTLRDRVQAVGPWLNQWLLRRPDASAALEAEIHQLWQSWHRVEQALAQRPSMPPAKLAEAAGELEKNLGVIQAKLDKQLQSLRSARTVDLTDCRNVYRETEAALAVPHANIERRFELLSRQLRLSRQVLIEGHPIETPELKTTSLQLAQDHAQRQGGITLSRLGPDWFDRLNKPRAETFAQVRHRLDIFGVEEKWWESAQNAGEQIGHRLLRLSPDIARLTQIAPKAPLPEIQDNLHEADRLARLLDADVPLTPASLDPSGRYRRWETSEYLYFQAKRFWQDHWFDENPAAEPYFRAAARWFLLDSQNAVADLGPLPLAWQARKLDWDKTLQGAGELTLVDVTHRDTDEKGRLIPTKTPLALVTSELGLNREYRLQTLRPDDPFPAGRPVVWVEAFQGVTPVEPAERERKILPIDPQRRKLDEAATFVSRFVSPLISDAEANPSGAATAQRTSMVLKGLYRGQPIRFETRVELHPVAETIVRQYPPPTKASVAVRTPRDTFIRTGVAQGGIAFVLDCSGSMRAQDDAHPEKSRFTQAVNALGQVLRKLPKDTQVSVWMFGQAMGPEKTVEFAEQTIRPVLRPTLWDPRDGKQLDAVLAQLAYPQAVEPWNESPLARTLLMARDDLRTLKGFKTLIAISDADDTRFAKDEELKSRYKSFAQFLKGEFESGDIALNLVAFPPAKREESKAREDFKIIETFVTPGKIYEVTETNKLVEAMESVLKQRLNYFVEQQGRNVSVDDIPEDGLDISPAGTNYRWFGKGLPPGGHKVRIDAGQRVEKNILLHRGDLLLLDLTESPKGLTFERFLFSSEFPWKRSLENKRNDWRMAVLQNQAKKGTTTVSGGLEMLVTLEKTIDRRESILEQIKPRDAWLEVDAGPDDARLPSVRWSYLAGYPAPAWAINAPQWPTAPGSTTPTRPRVQMWWNPDEEARAAADLELGRVIDERERSVFLPNEPPVVLESVSIEKHRVEVQPGVFEIRNCVVVRLRHAPGRPVITRLQGLEPTGTEQRLYSAASKVTSLFWFNPDLDSKARFTEVTLARLRFVSLAAFKEEAQRRDFYLDIRDLPPPDPADFRPRVPVDLK